MAEIERIIEKGIVSSDFLNDEVIDGCEVKSKLKKVWAVLIDLLAEFDRVCKKYNLRYFLAYGSLIGAIRHNGFIPWDDDLDVMMLRDDYEKLLEIGPSEFKHPYFLQTPYTDKGYYFSFAKIRNSNTTGTSNVFKYESFNQGIYLDIFPLDNCILDGVQERYDKIKELILENSTYMRSHNPNPSEAEIVRRKKYLSQNRNQLKVWEEIQSIASQFNDLDTEYVIAGTNTILPYKKEIFSKKAFNESLYIDFYGLDIPIPKDYDSVLKITYGNYMQMPPESDRNWHCNCIFKPEVDYKSYLKMMQKDNKDI